MELREWLIILGLALVTLIVIDGVRRLKRQRRVPRLDQVGDNNNQVEGQRSGDDFDDNWELPNGGARVVKPASYAEVQPKPKLQRQEHPGPSRTLASFQALHQANAAVPEPAKAMPPPELVEQVKPAGQTRPVELETQPVTAQSAEQVQAQPTDAPNAVTEQAEPVAEQTAPEPLAERLEPTLSALDETPLEPQATTAAVEALSADPDDHDPHYDDDERYRLVDLEGMSDSIKDRSRRMGVSVQRFGATMRQRLAERSERKHEEKLERERQRAEKAAQEVERKRLEAEARAAKEVERRQEAEAIELADDDDPLFAPSRLRATEQKKSTPTPSKPIVATQSETDDAAEAAETVNADVVRAHPTLARALRHNVCAERARETLSQADEVIVISVLSRDEEGFSGEALLDLMLACGLRYSSDMGIFHRFETEDDASDL